MSNIKENNKLIAKFMGLKQDAPGSRYYDPNGNYHFIEELKYDSSWNELMDVVEKINELYISEWNFSSPLLLANIHKYVRNVKIKQAHNAVVEFIKHWKNECQKQ